MSFIMIVEVFLIIFTAIAIIKGNKTLSYVIKKKNLLKVLISIVIIIVTMEIKENITNFYISINISTFTLLFLLVGVMRFNIKEAIISIVFTMTCILASDLVAYIAMIMIEGNSEKEMTYMVYSKFIHTIFMYPMLRIDLRALEAITTMKWSDFDSSSKKMVLASVLCLASSVGIIIVDFSFLKSFHSMTVNVILCIVALALLVMSVLIVYITYKTPKKEGKHTSIMRELNVLQKIYGLEHYFDSRLINSPDLNYANSLLELLELWCKNNISMTINFFYTHDRMAVVLILDKVKQLDNKQREELETMTKNYTLHEKRDRLTNTYLINIKAH